MHLLTILNFDSELSIIQSYHKTREILNFFCNNLAIEKYRCSETTRNHLPLLYVIFVESLK